ncbi:MAG: VpsF family polysaccharide biosynthesis protein, partial [Methylobacteriaceae bacterium]|nr:VpsF family polysaccharide biosynthesis protein [Methylobacteriaceae bacterium]
LNGIDYDNAGGSALAKIHPGTYLAFAALACRLCAAANPWRTLQRLLLLQPGLLLYAAALTLLSIYVVVVSRSPVTPLIDTFLLALVLTLLLEGLDERIARLLALMLVGIFAIDALLALVEVSTGWRLIHISVPEGVTSDPTRTDLVFDWRADLATDWRATALFGHPLENAMLMGAFLICMASRGAAWLGSGLRLGLGILALLAMFAFGGRASLVICGFLLVLLGLTALARRLIEGRAFGLRAAAGVLLILPFIAFALAIIGETGLFDRVAERFRVDEGSALARLTMWSLFDPIPWRDLVLAPDQTVVKTWQRLQGLEFGIESFWVGFALTYGLIMSAVLIAGLAAFVMSIVRLAGRGAATVFLFFFAVASTSTSISSKTTGFAILTALILLVLRKDDRSRDRSKRLLSSRGGGDEYLPA